MTEFKADLSKTPFDDYNDNVKNILGDTETDFTDKLIIENPGLIRDVITALMIKSIVNAQMGGELIKFLKKNEIEVDSKKLGHLRVIDYHLTHDIDSLYAFIDELLEETE